MPTGFEGPDVASEELRENGYSTRIYPICGGRREVAVAALVGFGHITL